jgi:hypothetical protein
MRMRHTGSNYSGDEDYQGESESPNERLRFPAKPANYRDIDDRERTKLWAIPRRQSAARHD